MEADKEKSQKNRSPRRSAQVPTGHNGIRMPVFCKTTLSGLQLLVKKENGLCRTKGPTPQRPGMKNGRHEIGVAEFG
jgi:hypothetical protein